MSKKACITKECSGGMIYVNEAMGCQIFIGIGKAFVKLVSVSSLHQQL